MDRPFLTPGEMAGLLGVSTRTIYNLCWSGQIPFIKVGSHTRIHRDVIHTMVAQGTKAENGRYASTSGFAGSKGAKTPETPRAMQKRLAAEAAAADNADPAKS